MSEKRPGIEMVQKHLSTLDDPVVVDVGAHVGKTVQAWMDANSGAYVYALEPCADICASLGARFYWNKRFAAFGIAIGNEAKKHIYLPRKKGKDRSQGATLFRGTVKNKKRAGDIDGYDKFDVCTVSLESFIAKLGIERIDLLKLNCEGAEYEILPTLPDCVQAVFVSWHKDKAFDTAKYAQEAAFGRARMILLGMKRVSNVKRGDHTWEFWKK